MRELPASMRQRGAVQLVEPDRLRGKQIDPAAEVAFAQDGRLLVRTGGGFLSQARLIEIPRTDLKVTADGGQFTVAGGLVTELVITAVEGSSLRAVLERLAAGGDPTDAWGPGPGWRLVGQVHPVVLLLDPEDPRRPPKGRVLGRARSTPLLWTSDAGDVAIDDPHEPARLEGGRILAVSRAEGALVFHAFAAVPDGWIVGLRTNGVRLDVETRGDAPRAVLPVAVAGSVGGRDVEAALLVRAGERLLLLDDAAEPVASVDLGACGWAWHRRLLVLGPQASLVAEVAEDRARWLMDGRSPDPALLDGGSAGPVRASVEGEELVVRGAGERRVPLAELEPEAVVAEPRGEAMALSVAGVPLLGLASTLAALREQVLGTGGGATLQQASLADLYRAWHRLRTERWLWWVYGPVFLTDRHLVHAGRLEREPGEAHERHVRRRVITETLIVASQVRTVRLRAGAAPAALPYALLQEEAEWLDEITGGQGAEALVRARSELLGDFRLHLRNALAHTSFALADAERAVSRLEPVHHPELRGGAPSVWGRVGLGTAMLFLAPISGVITIGHAVVGRFTDDLAKDAGATALVDRFGPECRASWALLVDVAALSALETYNHLQVLWQKLAARDRALAGGAEDRVRAALTRRIRELRAERAVPLEGLHGETVGDVCDAMAEWRTRGPKELVDRLTARGAGAVVE